MLGGLQRCGSTAHLLGNKTIHNKPPHEPKKTPYKFTAESSLRVLSPLHIFLPQEWQFNTNYKIECAEYSKSIQDRKKDGFQTTIKAQLYDILAWNTHGTAEDNNHLRMIDKTYWLEREVSVSSSGWKLSTNEYFPDCIPKKLTNFLLICLCRVKSFTSARFQVLQYDVGTMLANNPIKRDWVAWADQEGRATFKNCKDKNDRIEKATACLKGLERKALHYGRTHRENTHISKILENMMIYHWLLWYMIHDNTSFENAILFLPADTIPYKESRLNVFHHDWILNNILNPCVDVYNLLGNDKSKTYRIFNEHLGYKQSDLRKRLRRVSYTAWPHPWLMYLWTIHGHPPLLKAIRHYKSYGLMKFKAGSRATMMRIDGT
jgi:hypothetical protein